MVVLHSQSMFVSLLLAPKVLDTLQLLAGL